MSKRLCNHLSFNKEIYLYIFIYISLVFLHWSISFFCMCGLGKAVPGQGIRMTTGICDFYSADNRGKGHYSHRHLRICICFCFYLQGISFFVFNAFLNVLSQKNYFVFVLGIFISIIKIIFILVKSCKNCH